MKAPKNIVRFSTLLAVIGLFLAGCKTTYYMEVDAISNPNLAAGETYVLLPADPNTDPNNLRFLEAARYIKSALASKGYYEAKDELSAEMVIELNFGMEAPRQEIRVTEEPVYVYVRGHSRIERRQYTDPVSGKTVVRSVRVPGYRHSRFVGYQERVHSYTITEKHLELVARELSDEPSNIEYWRISVRNFDSGSDLREYLPVLASAAAEYVGVDTHSKEKFKIREDDERLLKIKSKPAR